jgi:hypothetical protein
MRPRKDVIVYCASEYERDLLCFALRLRPGMRIIDVETVDELRAKVVDALGRNKLGCVVVLRGKAEPEAARLCDPELLPEGVPALEILLSQAMTPVLASRTMQLPGPPIMALIVEQVRMLCARKRGPKQVQGVPVEAVKCDMEAAA